MSGKGVTKEGWDLIIMHEPLSGLYTIEYYTSEMINQCLNSNSHLNNDLHFAIIGR
ncbi:MAG: hypothetical protein U5K54_23335 [Cytophagales bacterium]|nr:hypothetical protein [Cytophagales bacterium]